MRLDRFLKVTQIIKRRSVAKETANEGVISINGRKAKPSAEIKIGDTIELDMWNFRKLIEVVELPTGASIPKGDVDRYIKTIQYEVK
ncbi:MAG: RNA-binding S4 domain-containing protein [Deferribacteraceae bacterium]|jgi:ribosomal 50S subunit-recycling heat shock protein|nr:RNA-binding S4 domain-containing protein [Deferribacteraceae bacterium]